MSAFRPVFTRRLAERLQNGHVFNLTAPRGQGSTRLLHDLAQQMPHAVYLDLADPTLTPERAWAEAADAGHHSWESILQVWKQADRAPVLLLDHLDRIGNSEAFGASFFAPLQQMWVSPRLGMLYATEKPLPNIRDDFGWPEGEVVALPPMGYKRIKEEVLRHFPELKNWTPLATPIFSHPQPYDFLQFVIERLKGHPDLLQEPIDHWMPSLIEDFNRLHDLDVQPVRPESGSWWQRLRGRL